MDNKQVINSMAAALKECQKALHFNEAGSQWGVNDCIHMAIYHLRHGSGVPLDADAYPTIEE